MEPTKPKERILELDILRGFAIFGMIIWNFKSRSMGFYYSEGFLNSIVTNLISILDFEYIIHLLFAYLFGWGLAMQLCLRKDNKIDKAMYFRRLAVLFSIGIMHCCFWYRPDIIHLFAIYGACLLLFVNMSNRMILVSAIFLIGAPVWMHEILYRIISPQFYYNFGSYHSLKAQTIISSNYSELVFMRSREIINEIAHPATYIRDLDTLGAMLFGLYTFNKGVFKDIKDNLRFISNVLFYSFVLMVLSSSIIFLISQLVVLDRYQFGPFSSILSFMLSENRQDILLSFFKLYFHNAYSIFYICLIVIILHNSTIAKLFIPFASIGRLSLSNYLLHSLIGTTLFYGYGFALYRKLGCAKGELLAIIVLSFQAILSSWWLKTFQLGPAEWLWRSMTYLKFQSVLVNK